VRSWLRLLLVTLGLLGTGSALAGPAPMLAHDGPSLPTDSTEGWQGWQIALAKTITYRLISSVDLLIGGYMLTGDEVKTVGLAAVVALEKSAVYYGHELAWNQFGPPPEELSPTDRSFIKAITYRLVSMTNMFILSYIATDSIELSAAFVTASALYGTGIYFLHEMAWSHYGPVPQSVPRR